MFDTNYGLRCETTPPVSSPDTVLELDVTVRPLYTGTGTIFVSGRGGGHPVGVVESPVSGDLGSLHHVVLFEEGSLFESRWSIQVTSDLPYIGFNIGVTYDSVLVYDAMHPVWSEEVAQSLGYRTPDFYRTLTIENVIQQ